MYIHVYIYTYAPFIYTSTTRPNPPENQKKHKPTQTPKTALRQALVGKTPDPITVPLPISRAAPPRACYGCPALDYELNYAGPVGQVVETLEGELGVRNPKVCVLGLGFLWIGPAGE